MRWHWQEGKKENLADCTLFLSLSLFFSLSLSLYVCVYVWVCTVCAACGHFHMGSRAKANMEGRRNETFGSLQQNLLCVFFW